jgi:hypothetical protein
MGLDDIADSCRVYICGLQRPVARSSRLIIHRSKSLVSRPSGSIHRFPSRPSLVSVGWQGALEVQGGSRSEQMVSGLRLLAEQVILSGTHW